MAVPDDMGIPMRLHPHAGLELAQRMVLKEQTPVESLMEWAREQIQEHGIRINTDDYQRLLDAADILTIATERQKYFRHIFALALAQGAAHASLQPVPTAENRVPVFPIRFPFDG